MVHARDARYPGNEICLRGFRQYFFEIPLICPLCRLGGATWFRLNLVPVYLAFNIPYFVVCVSSHLDKTFTIYV